MVKVTITSECGKTRTFETVDEEHPPVEGEKLHWVGRGDYALARETTIKVPLWKKLFRKGKEII